MKDLISRFRANIITNGTSAFEEEKWDEISIGPLRFQVSSVIFAQGLPVETDLTLDQNGDRWESCLVFDSYPQNLSRRVYDICILGDPLEIPIPYTQQRRQQSVSSEEESKNVPCFRWSRAQCCLHLITSLSEISSLSELITSSPLLVISTFSPFPKKPNFLPQSLCPLCSLLSAILFLQLPQGLSSDVTTLERIFLTHRMVKLCRAPAHPFRVYKDGDQVCFVPHCTSRA